MKSNDAFMPESYVPNSAKSKITIKSKNMTGTDLPTGIEDVHPYFIYDNSVQFDKIDRERPAVKKDGTVIYTWAILPGIINNKPETLKYILAKGRMLDKSN